MKLLLAAVCSTLLFISVYIYYYVDLSIFFQKQGVLANEAPEKEVAITRDLYEITAYTAGFESTGKTPRHPAYGITASGAAVRENYTIACPPELKFGTKVFIPYFSQTFVCEDRGGAIKGKTIDVYMEKLDDARQFGRQMLEVHIFDPN